MLVGHSQIPSFIRSALANTRAVTLTLDKIGVNNTPNSGSFMYDPINSPLKNTQQLNVDWSQFENHTFYMNAEAKVNLAFNTIINGFPFDGTRQDLEAFIEKLGGFERWVLTSFPKYRGALHLSGSWIVVNDQEGGMFSSIAQKSSGMSVISPEDSSFSIEMQLFTPNETNDVSVITQKHEESTNIGFTAFISSSTTSTADVTFSVYSGSLHTTVTTQVDKGVYNHILFSFNREQVDAEGTATVRVNSREEVQATSSIKLGDLHIGTSQFMIGSGSSYSLGTSIVTPITTLSGTLDELRVFHSTRTPQQFNKYARRALNVDDSVKLYYKFNEPAPVIIGDADDPMNAIILDSSGNGLHALVENFTSQSRVDVSEDGANPMTLENELFCPILFPAHADVVAFNASLILSASLYDEANPNLITRLVPSHYLIDGADSEGKVEELDFSNSIPGLPGQGSPGSPQMMVSLLYIYALAFDELKLFIDNIRNVRYVNYDDDETAHDAMLMDIARSYGIDIAPLFNDANIDQYIHGDDIDDEYSTTDKSLKSVQCALMRRVLTNINDIIQSKGTLASVKTFLMSLGIDPNNSLRLREFGGPSRRNITGFRETTRIATPFIDMSSSITTLTSHELSASALGEPGWPEPPSSGTVLLTSGSWTCEGLYKFTPGRSASPQSLCHFSIDGFAAPSDGPNKWLNVVAVSGSTSQELHLYVNSEFPNATPTPFLDLSLSMSGSGIFDGNVWHVSFGRMRADDPLRGTQNFTSSSYFLRVARASDGEISESYSTSCGFNERNDQVTNYNIQESLTDAGSTTSSRVVVGPETHTASTPLFLDDATTAPTPEDAVLASHETFTGKVGLVRFWSKFITSDEWKAHVLDHRSTGVVKPASNWNYATRDDGTWNRLRMSVVEKQDDVISDSSGELLLLDFSENNTHALLTGAVPSTRVLVGETLDVSYISPLYDEASASEKVRIRGYNDITLVENHPWSQVSPVFNVPLNEEPSDDTRFAVEYSLVDALNRDIITMFANLDSLNDAIGAPEMMFGVDYNNLATLRNVYFNRISDKLDFAKFYEFYRWFDETIATFIEQIIPHKTKCRGVSHIIESHMLERHKLQYHNNEMYVRELNRANISNVLLMRQIVGSIKKW